MMQCPRTRARTTCEVAWSGSREVIGGGTILAARRSHRESKDIDIRIRIVDGIDALTRIDEGPARIIALDRAMQEAGAESVLRMSAHQRTYLFGDTKSRDTRK